MGSCPRFHGGLILVVVGGAELFTGNNLVVMAWASRRVTTRALLRGWAIVYARNFVGAVATALLVFLGGAYRFGDGAWDATAMAIAVAKMRLGFGQAVALGVLCNAVVYRDKPLNSYVRRSPSAARLRAAARGGSVPSRYRCLTRQGPAGS